LSSFLHIPNRAGALTPITQSRPLTLISLFFVSAAAVFGAEAFRPAYSCTESDLQFAGMTCSEAEPCPIYLEVSHVYPLGRKLFVTGNIHSALVTLYSVLLQSDDAGTTWQERVERVRGGEVDRIQFTNFDTGWVSGQRVTPLPGDPFLLLTTDGGKSWRKQEVLPEGTTGSIQKMWFSSPKEGMVVIDRGASGEDQMRYSRYETMTGGTSWMIRESAEKAIGLPAGTAGAEEEIWRAVGDTAGKRFSIERKTDAGWVAVPQRIALELARCTGEVAVPVGPPPSVTDLGAGAVGAGAGEPKKDYVEEFHLGPAPGEAAAKKKKPK
jgi:hypothetical protein